MVEYKSKIGYLFSGADGLMLNSEGKTSWIATDTGFAFGWKEDNGLCFMRVYSETPLTAPRGKCAYCSVHCTVDVLYGRANG